MGAIIGTVLNAVITKAAADGGKAISKTKLGANAMGATALTMIDWGAVANKDPQAIGQLVVLAVTYAMTLYGRWKASK